MMKKILGTITAISFFLSYSLPAYAQVKICPENTGPEGGPGAGFSKLCDINAKNIGPVISKIITVLLIVAVLISLFFLIWGGIKWILSGGDKQGVESARNHIIAAIVGLVIALLAFFIINIISALFGFSLTAIELPDFTK